MARAASTGRLSRRAVSLPLMGSTSALKAAMQLPAELPGPRLCRSMCHRAGTGRRRLSWVLQLLEAWWALVLKPGSRPVMRRANRPLSVRRQMRWTVSPKPCWAAPVCLSVIRSDRMRLRRAETRLGWSRLAASRLAASPRLWRQVSRVKEPATALRRSGWPASSAPRPPRLPKGLARRERSH